MVFSSVKRFSRFDKSNYVLKDTKAGQLLHAIVFKSDGCSLK